MVNLIAWVILGGFLGWFASMTLSSGAGQNTWTSIAAGIVGAIVAGGVLSPLFGISNINQNNFSIAALGVSLTGAIILLVLLDYFRYGSLG